LRSVGRAFYRVSACPESLLGIFKEGALPAPRAVITFISLLILKGSRVFEKPCQTARNACNELAASSFPPVPLISHG